MTDVKIRPAQPDDVDAVAHVKVIGWRTTYADLVPPDVLARFLDETAQRAAAAALLDEPDVLLLVADVEGEVIGFCTGATSTGYIDSLHVSPEWRGHGVGEQLLDAVATALFEHGCPEISLHVVEGNERACRFYERLGGERTGTSPAAWASEVTEAHFRWTTWRRRSPVRGRR